MQSPACPRCDRAARTQSSRPGWRRSEHAVVGVTSWLASGVTSACSSFLPILGQLRPANDISKSLSGGPTACDARLENLILTGCSGDCGSSFVQLEVGSCPLVASGKSVHRGRSGVPLFMKMWNCGSDGPNTLPPLKS